MIRVPFPNETLEAAREKKSAAQRAQRSAGAAKEIKTLIGDSVERAAPVSTPSAAGPSRPRGLPAIVAVALLSATLAAGYELTEKLKLGADLEYALNIDFWQAIKGYGGPVRAPGEAVRALEEAKKVDDGPVIVHALTTKGKGHPAAESDYYKWHATGPFDLKTGKPIKSPAKAPTYTKVFGDTLCQLMEKDEKVVALTAAMPDGTGVCEALEKFPERSFDVGIAEQHCVTFAAGMSCEGLKPVCAIYSTFLQRGFDQLIHDVCIQNLNVKFCLDRGGVAGGDGPTHHGLLDIAYLRAVPNIAVMAPKDEGEMRDMLFTMIEHLGPAAMRYPRGNGVGADIARAPQLLEIGKGEILRDGGEIAIVAYGSMVHPALQAAENLAKEKIETTVVNARFVKPLDAQLLLALAQTKRLIVTVEEAYLAGGFGSAVLELLEENGLQDKVRVVRMGIPDRLVTHGDPKLLLAKYGLDADGIYMRVKESIDVLDDRRAKPKKVSR